MFTATLRKTMNTNHLTSSPMRVDQLVWPTARERCASLSCAPTAFSTTYLSAYPMKYATMYPRIRTRIARTNPGIISRSCINNVLKG